MGLVCHRSIVFSDMPLGMHETFLRLRADHAMLRELGGLVVVNAEGMWGYSGGVSFGEGAIEDGVIGIQAVVDRLTSRAARMDHPEYLLDDETHCLLVTSTDSTADSIARLLEVMEGTMPDNKRCDWLHIEWSRGLVFSVAESLISDWNGGEFDRNCIRNRTATEKVEYEHHEWSAALIQYLESRMLARRGAIDLDGEKHPLRTFGFATLDFSQTEGRRFLEARALIDKVAQEDERIDLDVVFRRCSEALKGGRNLFSQALSQANMPLNIANLVSNDEDFAQFDVRQRLSDFRDHVTNETGAIEKVEASIEEGVEDLKSQLNQVLQQTDNSAQERLTVIQSLLGRMPDRTVGKPLRSTLMLDDCEQECLEALARMSNHEQEIPSVQELHVKRRMCAEFADNIVHLERAMAIDEEAGLDTEEDEKELSKLSEDLEQCTQQYGVLRTRFARFRRRMFAALSAQWMEGLFERLVEEARHEPEPYVVEEQPLLSAREKRLLMTTAVTLPAWLTIAWMINVLFWFEQAMMSLAYGLVWAAVISYRMRARKPKAPPSPMVEQRKKFIKAAEQYHTEMVRFAALTRFQTAFDEQIRKPLIIEHNRLSAILNGLRKEAGSAQKEVESAFIEVDFIQHIGDSDSFNRYYDEELEDPIAAVPSIVQVYLDLLRSGIRQWDEHDAVLRYKALIRERVHQHLDELEQFDMLHFLTDDDRDGVPVFVNPALPPLEELIRRATISLGVLHDCGAEQDGQLKVFMGRSDNSLLVDRFKDRMGRLFPEASQARLQFIETDDANRIGFLRTVDIRMEAMKRRERADAEESGSSHEQREEEDSRSTVSVLDHKGFGVVSGDQLTFSLRGQAVVFDLPRFTPEEREAILGLDHFERGVRLVPGKDVEDIVYERILGHDQHDAQLEAIVVQARDWSARLGVSLPEVLISLVQAIPYEIGTHEKYPIETLMLGHGDCSDKSTLLKKLLGLCGVNSALLLYEGLKHMALGVAVPSGSEGHMVKGYAFMECTRPFVVGNEPYELVGGGSPANEEAELLLSDPSLSPWSGYSEYREAAKAGFPSVRDDEDDTPLRNSWREQS